MYKLWFIGFIFIGALGLSARAQPHPILDDFIALRDGNTVLLKWTISSGSTCNGIRIYRAEDTINYIQVGDIAGVCGSSTSPVPYSFTDLSPIPNKINYYRLELGTQGFSKFVFIEFIVLGNEGYLIRPQPVTDNAVIYFVNPNNAPYTFKVYNEMGQLVQKVENTKADSFSFNRAGLSSGTYSFTIENEDKIKAKGKIIVL